MTIGSEQRSSDVCPSRFAMRMLHRIRWLTVIGSSACVGVAVAGSAMRNVVTTSLFKDSSLSSSESREVRGDDDEEDEGEAEPGGDST